MYPLGLSILHCLARYAERIRADVLKLRLHTISRECRLIVLVRLLPTPVGVGS